MLIFTYFCFFSAANAEALTSLMVLLKQEGLVDGTECTGYIMLFMLLFCSSHKIMRVCSTEWLQCTQVRDRYDQGEGGGALVFMGGTFMCSWTREPLGMGQQDYFFWHFVCEIFWLVWDPSTIQHFFATFTLDLGKKKVSIQKISGEIKYKKYIVIFLLPESETIYGKWYFFFHFLYEIFELEWDPSTIQHFSTTFLLLIQPKTKNFSIQTIWGEMK